MQDLVVIDFEGAKEPLLCPARVDTRCVRSEDWFDGKPGAPCRQQQRQQSTDAPPACSLRVRPAWWGPDADAACLMLLQGGAARDARFLIYDRGRPLLSLSVVIGSAAVMSTHLTPRSSSPFFSSLRHTEAREERCQTRTVTSG
jgi:hypothetical protein